MTSHTPGPWSIYDYGEEEAPTLVIHKDSNTRVCFLATPGSHGDPARIECDAHLIAAAPDLLDACRVALGWMTGGMDGDWRDCNPQELLRSAITKAEVSHKPDE